MTVRSSSIQYLSLPDFLAIDECFHRCYSPVVCHGLLFYAGWGLTKDNVSCVRRTKTLSLDKLVFGTLITYPRYFNSDNNIFVEPEDAVDELAILALKEPKTRAWYRKMLRLLIILMAHLR